MDLRISKETLEKIKNSAQLQKDLEEGKSFQQIFGYSVEAMDKFYSAAWNLFQRQLYDESSNAFFFLTTLNPRVHLYWLGLAMSEQLKEEYHEALMAYTMAVMTDGENPLPHYHSAACYYALQDIQNAKVSLELALKCCGDHPEHLSVKLQCQASLDRLST